MLKTVKQSLLILGLTILLSACADNKQYETAMCTLIDISGTYAEEKTNVAKIIKAHILRKMNLGDSLFFITIDSNSYEEENLKGHITLEHTPSKANRQKQAFASKLDEFASTPGQAKHTDISGALMLCADYLRSTGAGRQAIFIFSDMQEELQQGLKREFTETEFDNVNIAAMNVIKLRQDSNDPEVYRKRLSEWGTRLTASGAKQWSIIIDSQKIATYIDQL